MNPLAHELVQHGLVIAIVFGCVVGLARTISREMTGSGGGCGSGCAKSKGAIPPVVTTIAPLKSPPIRPPTDA